MATNGEAQQYQGFPGGQFGTNMAPVAVVDPPEASDADYQAGIAGMQFLGNEELSSQPYVTGLMTPDPTMGSDDSYSQYDPSPAMVWRNCPHNQPVSQRYAS